MTLSDFLKNQILSEPLHDALKSLLGKEMPLDKLRHEFQEWVKRYDKLKQQYESREKDFQIQLQKNVKEQEKLQEKYLKQLKIQEQKFLEKIKEQEKEFQYQLNKSAKEYQELQKQNFGLYQTREKEFQKELEILQQQLHEKQQEYQKIQQLYLEKIEEAQHIQAELEMLSEDIVSETRWRERASFAMVFLPRLLTHITPFEFAQICGGHHLPDIPTPYIPPSEGTIQIKKKQFQELSKKEQLWVSRFCVDLSKHFGAEIDYHIRSEIQKIADDQNET